MLVLVGFSVAVNQVQGETQKREGKSAAKLREEADDATAVTRAKKCVERLQKVLAQFPANEENLDGPARDVCIGACCSSLIVIADA